MIVCFKIKKLYASIITLVIVFCIIAFWVSQINSNATQEMEEEKDYIKWVDFNVTASAMQKAMDIDINSYYNDGPRYNWIELLSYLGVKYGGDFKRYKEKDITDLINKLEEGKTIGELTNEKYYSYYLEAYTAILAEFVGEYRIQEYTDDGDLVWAKKYGLKAFSPIAAGYYYNHFDDFGSGRNYGYKRKHLGHDLMGNIGTPIIAIESGTVEELGWNQYGGWRIGIRSFDKKRYYYYAHLRKDSPYSEGLEKGNTVKAGDVIGYLGRTGYSTSENVNNINENHLHYGIQLIFDESQKDGINQIWIDCYEVTKFLEKNRVKVQKIEGSKNFKRLLDFEEAP